MWKSLSHGVVFRNLVQWSLKFRSYSIFHWGISRWLKYIKLSRKNWDWILIFITYILISRHFVGKLSHIRLKITLLFVFCDLIKEPFRNDFLYGFTFLFIYKRIIPPPVVFIHEPLLYEKTSEIAFTQHHPRYWIPMIFRFLLILNWTERIVDSGKYFRLIIKFLKVFLMIIGWDLLMLLSRFIY